MIDIGETILAVVGIRRVISRTLTTITPEEWREIRGYQKAIDAAAKALVAGEGYGPGPYRPINYDKMLAQLPVDLTPQALRPIVASFPPDELESAMSFQGHCARAINYLRTCFPISTITTIAGIENLPPSSIQVGGFEDTLELIDRPLALFEAIAEDRLTSGLAIDVIRVYPSIYTAILQAIVSQVLAAKAKAADYEPPWPRSLSALLGAPGVPATLRTQLQQAAAAQVTKPSKPTTPREDKTTEQRQAPPSQAAEIRQNQ